MQNITILIADDHTLIRETWSFILNANSQYSVIGEAGSAEEAIELAKKLRPNVVLMDINLPGINGIEATTQIRKFSPLTKILGVSLHTQPTYAKRMIQSGASGYITKNSSKEEMFKAIDEISSGKKYICKEIKDILSEQVLQNEDQPTGVNALTKREMEIIAHIRKGDSSKEIASALFLSVKTIEVHRYNILKKLNLKNAAALVNFINSTAIGVIS